MANANAHTETLICCVDGRILGLSSGPLRVFPMVGGSCPTPCPLIAESGLGTNFSPNVLQGLVYERAEDRLLCFPFCVAVACSFGWSCPCQLMPAVIQFSAVFRFATELHAAKPFGLPCFGEMLLRAYQAWHYSQAYGALMVFWPWLF